MRQSTRELMKRAIIAMLNCSLAAQGKTVRVVEISDDFETSIIYDGMDRMKVRSEDLLPEDPPCQETNVTNRGANAQDVQRVRRTRILKYAPPRI